MSQSSYESFRREAEGKPALREEEPLQRPYVRICKILSSYRMPSLNNCNILEAAEAFPSDGFPYRRLRTLTVDDLTFEVYEGQGGHLPGETVFIERSHKMVFIGDVFVNIKAFSKERAEFNRIAPYLLTSVDCNPALAKKERRALPALLGPGTWSVFGSHGGCIDGRFRTKRRDSKKEGEEATAFKRLPLPLLGKDRTCKRVRTGTERVSEPLKHSCGRPAFPLPARHAC